MIFQHLLGCHIMLHGYKRILIEVPFPLNARETQYSEALLQATQAAKRCRISRPRAWLAFMATGVTARSPTEKLLIHGENHRVKTMEMAGASLSLHLLDAELEKLLLAPASCPFWKV